MDTVSNFDNPGDCQSKNLSPRVGNENNSPARHVANLVDHKRVEGAAAAAIVDMEGKPTSASMPLATNKLKSQQQQQQQHHQFRAPQQFVKHKKASSSTSTPSATTTATVTATANASSLNNNKKNKCWNKRQNRTAKHNTGSSNSNSSGSGGSCGPQTAATTNNPSSPPNAQSLAEEKTGLTKADVENIQNLKNQGHNYYHNYPHPHYSSNHHGPGGGGGGGIGNMPPNDNRLGLSLSSADKLGYGHGHLKTQQQPLHKKPLPSHRGGGGGGGGGGGAAGGGGGGHNNHNHHHHHILCAGSAHNTMGSGVGNNAGSGTGVNANNLSCCHINGCGSHMGKDNQALNNNSNPNNSSASIQFCCIRSKFFLPDKRPRKGNFIPPTKFLLGGNISDPLNLSSLQNETGDTSIKITPATTPRQSPITTPPKVEVIIPPNIHDPLHLLDPVDSTEYEKQLTSPMKRAVVGGVGGGILGLPSAGVGGAIILGLRGAQNSKAHKHRHRKNRKPKRKRYDSCNSTTSTLGDALDDITPSALINASSSTEKGLLSVSLEAENKSQDQNNEGGVSSSGGDDDDNDRPERNLCSPQEQLSLSHNIADTKVANIDVDTTSQQAKSPTPTPVTQLAQEPMDSSGAGMVGSVSTTTTAISFGEFRERACRDLRLDLISTTGSNSCGNSVVSSTGCGGGGGSRKRKISESNNSQKSKVS